MPRVLDGNRVADDIKNDLKPRIAALVAIGRPPGLAVVLVGHNPASEIYVRRKVKACRDLGIYSESITPPDSISTGDLLTVVEQLNARADIDGILVQLPLPRQVDSKRIELAVSPDKDVDGFHPCNVGRLVAGLPGPRACTPAGIIELLKRSQIAVAGRRAVVVGRSDIVGKPVALLLLHEHATVTICHSRTPDLAAVCREADILVAAIGRAAMITGDYIKPGAAVIDVGTNRVANRDEVVRLFGFAGGAAAGQPAGGSAPAWSPADAQGGPASILAGRLASFDKHGSLLVGDVHPVDVAAKASAYTPVPGGVGPLTIAMLMVNTVAAAELHLGVC